ncbi:branched-chain amino acid transport system ATP-binding protein [Limimaricola variabilis]|jgi:branched-chain amino acid transport system ATP-binding protein|uniref:Branched-chain amino acid transport system ATP-binding protein n=1 Tax=Limimaricola variabilis TaxID=1492771 RepID=A0ABR6HJ80_9RHOB|nr:ABC transporter ATP-binding protein [Limimaricola variabilis]MBB3710513.1 branched-chain amino acid transport system ATP-binding protein [Limimaricola variabilis]
MSAPAIDTAAQPILSARGLVKSFGGFKAVDGVDLDVAPGSIHALIGPNGAGKSTLFGLLTRFHTLSAGKITLDGHDISHTKPAEVVRLGMVRSFQISAIFPHLTALENVRVALQRRHGFDRQFWKPVASLRALDAEAMSLLEAVGLQDLRDHVAVNLSYGRKRALEIATTLALDPKVMLLDEPMAGMAAADVAVVAELILKVRKGRTVLMVEHNLGVVEDLCDRVTVLARGRVLAEGGFDEVRADPVVKEAYIGASDDD